MDQELQEVIDAALKKLTYRTREVVKLRLCLSDGMRYTIPEVSRLFRISQARAQTIEKRGFEKMQKLDHPSVHRLTQLIEGCET